MLGQFSDWNPFLAPRVEEWSGRSPLPRLSLAPSPPRSRCRAVVGALAPPHGSLVGRNHLPGDVAHARPARIPARRAISSYGRRPAHLRTAAGHLHVPLERAWGACAQDPVSLRGRQQEAPLLSAPAAADPCGRTPHASSAGRGRARPPEPDDDGSRADPRAARARDEGRCGAAERDRRGWDAVDGELRRRHRLRRRRGLPEREVDRGRRSAGRNRLRCRLDLGERPEQRRPHPARPVGSDPGADLARGRGRRRGR